ncbi:MAG: transporter related protein [Tardiphaga sp.]|nr:transporter related protein [Tardiphaga sp.]
MRSFRPSGRAGMMQAQTQQSAQAGQPGVVPSGNPLLEVRDISVVFGGIIALNGISFNMHQGQILGLIGPNGA